MLRSKRILLYLVASTFALSAFAQLPVATATLYAEDAALLPPKEAMVKGRVNI